jgi:general secretion pathway protein I
MRAACAARRVRSSRAPRSSRGFTLLEVLVSFVILATASALLLGMLSGGLRQVARARSDTEASLYAQSTLDQLGIDAPLEPGVHEGVYGDGRYHYRLEVASMDDPAPVQAPVPVAAMPMALPAARLYRVLLEVRWGDAPAQRLRIATARARVADQLVEAGRQ